MTAPRKRSTSSTAASACTRARARCTPRGPGARARSRRRRRRAALCSAAHLQRRRRCRCWRASRTAAAIRTSRTTRPTCAASRSRSSFPTARAPTSRAERAALRLADVRRLPRSRAREHGPQRGGRGCRSTSRRTRSAATSLPREHRRAAPRRQLRHGPLLHGPRVSLDGGRRQHLLTPARAGSRRPASIGSARATPEARGRDYLQEEIVQRLAAGPVRWALEAQIAGRRRRRRRPRRREWPTERERVIVAARSSSTRSPRTPRPTAASSSSTRRASPTASSSAATRSCNFRAAPTRRPSSAACAERRAPPRGRLS